MLFSSGSMAPLSCWKPSFALGHPRQGDFNNWSSLFDVLSGAANALQQGRVCGITVLVSFPGGILVILILNCDTACNILALINT